MLSPDRSTKDSEWLDESLGNGVQFETALNDEWAFVIHTSRAALQKRWSVRLDCKGSLLQSHEFRCEPLVTWSGEFLNCVVQPIRMACKDQTVGKAEYIAKQIGGDNETSMLWMRKEDWVLNLLSTQWCLVVFFQPRNGSVQRCDKYRVQIFHTVRLKTLPSRLPSVKPVRWEGLASVRRSKAASPCLRPKSTMRWTPNPLVFVSNRHGLCDV